MKEIRINDIILKFISAKKFDEIKEHMEICCEEGLSNEYVAQQLIELGMNAYKFL